MTRRMATSLFSAAAAAVVKTESAAAQGPQLLTISSPQATASFDMRGGSLVDFRLAGAATNPFTWVERAAAGREPLRGHFICCDRWGAPSEAEIARGVPYHGEAPRILWKATGANTMAVTLPMAKLGIERSFRLQGASLRVTERVTNLDAMGRIYNLVQHPSIAPPFLDEQTFVDANATLGFAQTTPDQKPQPFPQAHKANLRHLHGDPLPNVVSYIIEADQGWVTAASPTSGLLLGYLWKTSEYPWLNLWRDVANGKPIARGLEFGSTGLHQPYPELTRRGKMLGRPLFAFLDAGQSVERSFTAFLQPLPKGATKVVRVREKESATKEAIPVAEFA